MRDRLRQIAYGKSLKIFLLLLLISCLPFAILGCGYTTRSMVSDKFKTIYIKPFVNRIDITRDSDAANKYRLYRPMLEAEVTKSLTGKFLRDGNIKPIKEEAADLVLSGQLKEFRKDPIRYDDNDDVSEYRVSIAVNLSLWDKKGAQLAWEENNFTGESTYFVSGRDAKSESQAVTDAVEDLSRRIVERTVEDW